MSVLVEAIVRCDAILISHAMLRIRYIAVLLRGRSTADNSLPSLFIGLTKAEPTLTATKIGIKPT